MERFFDRRRVEWRVSLALWGTFAAVANAGRDLRVDGSSMALLWIGVVVVAGLHTFWEVVYHGRAATANRDQGKELERIIRSTMGLKTAEEPTKYFYFVAHL